MKVSLNAIRKVNRLYGSADDPAAPDGADALIHKIGAQLAGIDEVVRYGDRFKDVLVARVVSCEDHPNADRLHVCKIDDGGKAEGVERDENGYVQVVCGAPNVRAGLTVAWLPPGSTVPSTVGKEPFVLEARPLRGVVSNGMLASARELTIGDDHSGIVELDTGAAPGTPFGEAYDLVGDVVLDMENKMFTHRPDCFGQLGIARELEGIQGRPYKSPEWYRLNPGFPDVETEEFRLEFYNELPRLVPRFTAIAMRDVTVKPSPVWLQIYLSRVGLRPINNIVDYTNFFMLETGQPLHAYDYDKAKAQDADAEHATIIVRQPKEGESLTLLNGKTLQPGKDTIMIATCDKLIGVGGVMGGGDTEVDENTRNIILECANFDMYSIRRTAMAHGLFTDAVTRFTKGQSPLQNLAVLAKIVDEIRRFANGKVASKLIDDHHLPAGMLERGSVHSPVQVSRQFINTRLGLNLSTEEMAKLLKNVEFTVEIKDDDLIVAAPFWRTDIAIPEDVVEEVGRLYGYDHLPLDLPQRDLTPARKNPILAYKARLRDTLAAAGANEVLTYSFAHGNLLRKAGQDPAQAYQLSNALSPDLQYYRVSLTPSLLDKIHPNIKAGHGQFALFEIGKAHILGKEEDGLPAEFERLALVFAADEKAAGGYAGAPYFQARVYAQQILEVFGLTEETVFEPLDSNDPDIAATYYEPGRAAIVRMSGTTIGRIGEYKASVRKAFKLPAFTAGFEFGLAPLLAQASGNVAAGRYRSLPRFPKVEQDVCLRVPATAAYGSVFGFIQKSLQESRPAHTYMNLAPIDIYQRPDDKEYKQITLRLSLTSYERTLTDEEVSKLLDHVAEVAKQTIQAQRV